MKVCTTCNAEYPDTERFCARDGTALRSRDGNANLVGTVIADRYHVLRKLGAGGMGEVYLAEHVRMKRKSAVKVMHPAMVNDPDAISRFNREAANACQILHANVAAIYDFGEGADGVVFLAMEYVEGESLARLLSASGPLPPPRAADIIRQIADGLDAAHRLGIVHRDLKPDNIIVGAHHDGRDNVKVVDFGISKAAGSEGQSVTHTGNVIGTPDYMSPEQLTGGIIDHRSDIYALALVAFNMLTGTLPFPSSSAHSSMLLRLTEPPRRLGDARPAVAWTPQSQAVLDGAMDVNVDRRHPSASAFATALADALGSVFASVPSNASMTTSRLPATGAHTFPPPTAPSGPFTTSFPNASGLTPADLSLIEAKLAVSIGPIARVLVRRAAATALTREALIASLAEEIDDAAERDRFRNACT